MWFLIFCLSFIHTFRFSFSFFSCILSTTYVYHCPLVHPLIFLFLYFHFLEAPSFFLLLFFLYFHLIPEALRLSQKIFFFPTWFHKFSSSLCDTWFHNLACLFGVIIFKVQTHTDMHGERRNRLCSTIPPPLLLLLTAKCMQPGVISSSFFFFDHLLLF